jgi:hypothetical protein
MFSPTISNLGTNSAFELSLSLQPSAQQSPYVTYVRIAGLNPQTFVDSIQSSLSRNVDTYDRLSWSTDIRYLPARMLQFAIDNFRIKNVTTATNTYEAIATRFDCNGFAKKLDSTAAWSESTSRNCSVDCLTNLCRNALVIMYDRAVATLASTEAVTLNLSATGRLILDENARPQLTSGTWLGRYTTAKTTSTVSGQFASP